MFESIVTFITGIGLAFTSIFNPTPITFPDPVIVEKPIIYTQEMNELRGEIEDLKLGAFAPAAGGTYRLRSSIGTTDTSINLSSFKEPVSNLPITMSSLNSDIGYGTLDPQSSTRKEFISFTGVTQNSDGSAQLTGVTRGLAFTSPFTASTTLRKSHPGQSIFILSDSPQLFNEYARRRSDETITGQWTFDVFPITASTSFASATTSGDVELATGLEAASSTLTGNQGTARLALHTDISTSTAPSSGNVIPVTGADGNLDIGFLAVNDFFSSTTVRVYTSSTTWTKPSDLAFIIVEGVGGGGAGGGKAANTAETGGSAGGGGYFKKIISADELPSTVFVTVGAGAVGDGNAGATGASTVFTGFATSTGGTGGGYSNTGALASGGTGGTATGGDINIPGGDGSATITVNTGADCVGGSSGGSVLGQPEGGSIYTTGSISGSNGTGYGSGGSGSCNENSGAIGGNGGNGADGVVIVTEFY